MSTVSDLDFVVPLLLFGGLVLMGIIMIVFKIADWTLTVCDWWEAQDAKMRARDEARATRKSEPLIRLTFSAHPQTDDEDYVEFPEPGTANTPEPTPEPFPAPGTLDIMSGGQFDIIKVTRPQLVAELACIVIIENDGKEVTFSQDDIAQFVGMRKQDASAIIRDVRGTTSEAFQFAQVGNRQSYKRIDVKKDRFPKGWDSDDLSADRYVGEEE